MAFNIFATATSDIPLANLDANFTMIGSSAVASTLYPTATTSITYGTAGTTHYFSGSGLAVTGTLSATSEIIGGSTGIGYTFAAEINGGLNGTLAIKNPTYNNTVMATWSSATSGDNIFIGFGTEGTYTARGSITYNRAGGLVAYNVTSDYRSKDVTGKYEGSGETIDQLKVYRGKMKDATISRPMMIAHEAQLVVPYAVTGEKDAENEKGEPIYQSMDHQIFVPLLIAEIQALRARVAKLEARLAALESYK
jgi:hypothetical protein